MYTLYLLLFTGMLTGQGCGGLYGLSLADIHILSPNILHLRP